MEAQLVWVPVAVLAVAFLYASVGHARASGYIAVMALAGFSSAALKPIALVLNILVASLGAFHFWRAGYFSWKLFWPFALLSTPAAWLGGYLHLSPAGFRPLLGIVLWLSAARFFIHPADPDEVKAPGMAVSLGTGAGIGLLAGLTGTGGGIFLTPLLLLRRWAFTRNAAGVTAVFILVNSCAGLLGHLGSGRAIPGVTWALAVAALAGGAAGAYFGSRRFSVPCLRVLLASVLVVAGGKLIFTL